jgi:sugar phosphate isomerase/epimerase
MVDLSFQLFSARKYPLYDTLKTVAELGYKYVEGYGGLDLASPDNGLGGVYADVAGLKQMLDKTGLGMPTAHIGLDLLELPERALELAGEIGIEVVICPWIAPAQRPKTAEGWGELGARMARIAEPFQKAGLTFGWHNHDFEFQPTDDGRLPIELMLAAAPGISAEVDVAWMVRGGIDPAPWLERNGDRIVAVHVKDLAPEGKNAAEDGWADVGKGILPWAELMHLVTEKTAARFFVAEHDNPSDVKRFAENTIAAVNSFGV